MNTWTDSINKQTVKTVHAVPDHLHNLIFIIGHIYKSVLQKSGLIRSESNNQTQNISTVTSSSDYRRNFFLILNPEADLKIQTNTLSYSYCFRLKLELDLE